MERFELKGGSRVVHGDSRAVLHTVVDAATALRVDTDRIAHLSPSSAGQRSSDPDSPHSSTRHLRSSARQNQGRALYATRIVVHVVQDAARGLSFHHVLPGFGRTASNLPASTRLVASQALPGTKARPRSRLIGSGSQRASERASQNAVSLRHQCSSKPRNRHRSSLSQHTSKRI